MSSASFAPQYAQLYFCRLVAQRATAAAAARAAWGPPCGTLRYADRVLAAAASPELDAAVVGVVFRDLRNKPSILKEYGKEATELMPAPPARSGLSYVSGGEGEDRVILEDETGRFALDVGDVEESFRALATGFVVAVRGREDKKTGTFKVSSVISAGMAPQKPVGELGGDLYVCLVSGLGLGGAKGTSVAPELLLEYLRANVGDEREAEMGASIVHLIVAGNSVAPPVVSGKGRDRAIAAAFLKPHLAVDEGTKEDVAAPIVHLDRFLTAAAAVLPTSLMPGEDDPVNYLLPQQPFHRCLLPSASRQKNLFRATNPYERHFDGRAFLGTAGQNVDDFVLYNAEAAEAVANGKCGNGDGMEAGAEKDAMEDIADGAGDDEGAKGGEASVALGIMQAMLENRHMAPTAPDTLGAYPFYKSDPFVVEESPHVFFAGNQPAFGSRLVEAETHTAAKSDGDSPEAGSAKVRLISVPRFDMTGTAVLVNLRTLDCTTTHFSDLMF